jgi:hypothetical protein
MNIRESIFNLEKELSVFFVKPFNLFPLPNEAPLEFPRISATSNHGFSTLNISLNSAQLNTNYDVSFASSWEKCESYIKERIYVIFDILMPFFNNTFIFSGLTTNITFDVDEKENAIDKLKSSLFKFVSPKPYDLLTKITFVKEEKYYINIMLQNQRLLNPLGIIGIPVRMLENNKCIGINLDVNDRYAVNYLPGYTSSRETMCNIFDITGEIISRKLGTIIAEGRFDI